MTSNFAFIVGAPRCGTTTISSWLTQHPDVCFSAVKEPHYFARHDLSGLDDAALRAEVDHDYLDRFFGQCSGAEQLRAEGSVTYLYIPERMETVLKLWPDAKFIIALRDPLSMLPSLHARLLVTGDENIAHFPKAWAKIGERARGRSIPRSAMDPRWLRYDEAGALGSRVQRFFEIVGRERCHVILFDDLASDPQGAYRALCGFLGLEPWAETRFKKRRAGKSFRYGWLQRFLKRPPKRLQTIMAGEQFRQREKKAGASEGRAVNTIFRLRKRLLDWNKVPARKVPLDPAVRAQIIDRLRDEVILLSRVIDRDLSHWLGGVPEASPAPGKSKLASP